MAAVKRGGYERKKRNSRSRVRNPLIVMKAEGHNKTEKIYFQDFGKSIGRKIEFAPGSRTDPPGMVAELKEYMSEVEFDKDLGDVAYCLIDSDENPEKDRQIAEADKQAVSSGINVIVSSPCFEIWFICHYCFPPRYSSNSAVLSDLRDEVPGYEKSTSGMFERTREFLPNAVSNAKHLEDNCIEYGYQHHTSAFSPSTEVYKIVEKMKN